MKEIAEMTKVTDISNSSRLRDVTLPQGWRVFKINGPLFFAAADRIFGELSSLASGSKGLLLYMDGVTLLDAGGLSALNKLISQCQRDQVELAIADLQFQPLRTLARAGMKPIPGVCHFYPSLQLALETIAVKPENHQQVIP